MHDILACPRCDKSPLTIDDNGVHCAACKTDFPLLAGMPWMFAEPDASMAEWRARMQFSLQSIKHEAAQLGAELQDEALRATTRRRLEHYKDALDQHGRALQDLMQPLQLHAPGGSYESYLALRTRLPVDQGLNTYYSNVHRDWSWGDAENQASMRELAAVLQGRTDLGQVLVLGAGAGRLAYDLHMQFNCARTVALDFNPLLMLVAHTVTRGEKLQLHEFPIAPRAPDDGAVLRTLAAPAAVRENFKLVLGDALRAPFVPGAFDTVLTPWLIDIISEDLPVLAARINLLLKNSGRWLNFGSLAFSAPQRARRYSVEETCSIIAECGFASPFVHEAKIPYMCSPASRHGRQETVFSFAAEKQATTARPERHRALPDWIVTGREPVPVLAAFRTQAMSTQIYAFIMSLIDGKRSIQDMALLLEQQKLMPRTEAEPAIRSFLIRMFDDAQKQTGF